MKFYALTLLAFPIIAQADQCLIPNTGYTPAPCVITADNGGVAWGQLTIEMQGKQLALFQHIGGTVLYDKTAKSVNLNSRLLETDEYWIDELKRPTEDEAKAAWNCYKQTNGALSVCLRRGY